MTLRRLPLLLLALLLAACSQAPTTALRFGIASAPTNLDPRYATDATSERIDRLLYRRLVDFDASARPVPDLATWTVLSPTHYRFHLGRDGRRFHDGSRLTADDVKATYDYVLDPAHGSPRRANLSVIRSVRVVDDDTVDFLLKHPDPLFPGYLGMGILPAAAIAAGRPFRDHPLGSGPFRFLDWPTPGRLRLQRIRDGQVVEFLRIPDPTVRVLKLVRGEIDLLQNDLPAELVTWLAQQPGIRVRRAPGSNFSYLGFNLRDPVTGQLAVRQAVAYGIDRRAVIRYVLAGGARPAGALLPPSHWAGLRNTTGYPYDPARARRLLAAAGFGPDHPLTLTYKTSSDPLRVRLATVLQAQLARVGIRVRLQSYDWGTFFGDIRAGRFQMYSLAWVGIKSPDIFRYAFLSSAVPPAGANRGGFRDAEVDRLIRAAETAPAMAQQAADYRAVQVRLLEELPYVPLWYEDQVAAVRDTVRDYRLAADGDYDGLRWVTRRAVTSGR